MRRGSFHPAAVLAVLLLVCAPAAAQISPGELSAPHASLEGSRGCLRCHESGQGVSPERCLECHELLGERIASGRGLHARSEYRECRRCHIEHHGEDFNLVWWGEAGRQEFRHALTGYPLDGRHASLGCRECHRRENMADPDRLRGRGKDLERTFLGLEPGCLSCHEEPHAGAYASDRCLSCHSQSAWKPAERFDHQGTAFPLAGRHQEVPCSRCHPVSDEAGEGAGRPVASFRGLSFARCTDCHRDEHDGQFGTRSCEECHSVKGFRPAVFDHARSPFPLTGRHRKVVCDRCHRPAGTDPASESSGKLRFRGIPHGDCSDCHRDPHQSRLGAVCAGCHHTAGWRDSPSPEFDHARTRYPLEGRHRGLACRSCHPADASLTRVGFEDCSTCHRDVHGGQFVDREDGGACEACHGVEGFRPSTYTRERHAEGRYGLDGAHREVACRSCHLPGSAGARQEVVEEVPVELLRFRFSSDGCQTCHRDPHEGLLDRFLGETGCASCHGTESWPGVDFDHALTKTPLSGAHTRTPCRGCHGGRGEGEIEIGSFRWKGLGSRCSDCHADPHAGQFRRGEAGTECERCHEPVAWKLLIFDHERDAAFSLKGKHREVPCASCHPREESGDSSLIRYRPRPVDCRGCHGRGPGRPGDQG